jgi:hypothetical protein
MHVCYVVGCAFCPLVGLCAISITKGACMRGLILILFLLLTNAHAKERTVITTKVTCFKLEKLVDQLKDNYGEEPIFMGKSELENNTVTMMFVNQNTGSYTVVGMGKDVGCVLDTGNKMQYRMPKVLENKLM